MHGSEVRLLLRLRQGAVLVASRGLRVQRRGVADLSVESDVGAERMGMIQNIAWSWPSFAVGIAALVAYACRVGRKNGVAIK